MIDFYTLVKKYKKPCSYSAGSPFGIIKPTHYIKAGCILIQLPTNHNAFIDMLNVEQPKTNFDLDKLGTVFAKLKSWHPKCKGNKMKSPMVKRLNKMKSPNIKSLFFNLILSTVGLTTWLIIFNLIFKSIHDISLLNYILTKI